MVNLITDSLPAFALGIVDIDDDLMNFFPETNESFFVHGLGRAIIWQDNDWDAYLTAYLIGHTADPNTYLGQTMAFTLSTTSCFMLSYEKQAQHFNNAFFQQIFVDCFFVGILLQIGICYIGHPRF